MLIAVAIATCLLTVTFSLGAAWSLCRASAQGERLGGYLGPEPDDDDWPIPGATL